MSPTSLPFRSANIPEIVNPISKGVEKDTFTTSPLSSPIDVLKDMRAYEVGRQRAKKAAELVKARERKEKGPAAVRNTWRPWGDKSKPTLRESNKASWFGGKEVRGLWDSDNEKQLEVEHAPTSLTVISKSDSVQGEVKLTDLVVSKKPRKNKEADFEVIPLPRPVIVLDEFTMHDMDVDEPWEHVYSNEDEKGDAPSYAEIVSAAN
jgi:hypothetical protein